MLALMLVVSAALAGVLWWSLARPTTARSTVPVLAAGDAGPEDDPSNPVTPAVNPPPAPNQAAADPMDAQAAMLPPALGTVTLARQKLRRGGLGSKVRGTFIVRNRNDFAIKDVEILCAFQGQGGYVTSRRRVLPDVIEAKHRETIANVLVGHINVTAPFGRCRLMGASRA